MVESSTPMFYGTGDRGVVLVILEGSAHAQYIFESDEGERLLSEIIRFLSEP
jgi:hypothetical protein